MFDEKFKVPQRSIGDAVHALAKAGLSAIPVVSGSAVELFQYVVQPPLEKRRETWMANIGEKLLELEAQGLKLQDLQNNEQFASAVMHASQLALRTHQEAKLNALRNAVVNVAKGQAPEEALLHLFFGFVDSFTELHLRILKVFQSPTPPSNMSGGGLGNVLEFNIAELRGRRDIYDQFWRDLNSRGLVNTEGLHVMMTGNGLAQKRTTSLGDAFLKIYCGVVMRSNSSLHTVALNADGM
ncbi:MAG: hypothetical protein HC782_03530 [Gammaproteobacteria bacterium]|nr:hypothetical protein [Gammaproteobacteria bacterium]